jgi:hypothetical protein
VPGAGPGRAPARGTPLPTGDQAVWPDLAWVRSGLLSRAATPSALTEARARLPSVWADTAADARRALAQRLVREVLGLVGPAVRDAAVAWLEALPATQQEAELAAAARRDRVALASAALAPLGRLLDALETGAALRRTTQAGRPTGPAGK